jgi:hypothetical protein
MPQFMQIPLGRPFSILMMLMGHAMAHSPQPVHLDLST